MSSLGLESVRAQVAIESPLSFPSAVRASWKLFQLHALNLLKIFAPVLLTFYVAAWGLFELAPIADSGAGGSETAGEASPAILIGAFLNIIIGTCVSSVLIGVGVARIAGARQEATESAPYPLRDLIAAGLVVAMVPVAVVFTGPLIIVLPLLLRVLLGPPVVVHEIVLNGKSLGDAIRGARSLLARNWGRVFLWLFTVALVLNLASTASFEASSRFLSDMLAASAPARFLLGLVAGAVEAILLVWLTVVGLVVYLDLQTRADAAVES